MLDVLQFQRMVALVCAVEGHRAHAEYLLPQRAHQFEIKDAVKQDLIGLRAEKAFAEGEPVIGDLIHGKAQRHAENALPVVPQHGILYRIECLVFLLFCHLYRSFLLQCSFF